MEKIILNGIFVDNYTNLKKVLFDLNKIDLEIIKFEKNRFIVPSLELFFKLNCKKSITIKKINQFLSILEMKNVLLEDDPLIFSDSDKYKLLIILALINKCSNLVMVYPNIYLDDNNVNLVLKILTKLSKEYKRNVYIVTNNIDFLYKECDNLIVYYKNKIIFNGNRKQIYNERNKILDNNLVLPKILNFISLVEDKMNIKLEPTCDIKELMKDIYRNV